MSGAGSSADRLFEHVVVYGTGLIGGSLAVAARRAGVVGRVTGVGRSRGNLETALEHDLVDAITVAADEPGLRAALADADLVVLAAPTETCVELMAPVAAMTGAGCVISDACSVKLPLCHKAAELGIAGRFVGAHPMAGAERSGAAAADGDLYEGCVTVVTTDGSGDQARARVARLWSAVGSRVLELDANTHDTTVALTSHLPQMVVFALAAAVDDHDSERVRALTGQGMRDTTRLAASEHAMWISIARANRDRLLATMDGFTGVWSRLRDAVAAGDEEALGEIMRAAARAREAIES